MAPPIYCRSRPALSALHFSPFSESRVHGNRGVALTTAELKRFREMSKALVERFWFPFTRVIQQDASLKGGMYPSVGSSDATMRVDSVKPKWDLNAYKFKENLETIKIADPFFSCQINNSYSQNTKLVEDFFIIMLSGFDIANVKIDSSNNQSLNTSSPNYVKSDEVRMNGSNATANSIVEEECDMSSSGHHPTVGGGAASEDYRTIKGSYTLAPTRSFLGWKPASTYAPLNITVPFTMQMETAPDSKLITHLSMKTPFNTHVLDHIGRDLGVHGVTGGADPTAQNVLLFDQIKTCLHSPQAVRMMVALRRAQVNPSIITGATLLSASRSQDSWASAMGLQ